jgi:oligopeptidase B
MNLEALPRSPLPPPPVVVRYRHSFLLHGVEIRDDYAWMRAGNWREVLEDPARLPPVLAEHLAQEQAYTAAVMAGTGDLIGKLVAEMRGRMQEADSSVPEPDGPFAYFTQQREGGQYRSYCRQPREGGPTTVLLDGDREAAGKPFFDLSEATHSPDHRLFAWSEDLSGAERYTIRIRDIATGAELPDTVRSTDGEMVWLKDASGFYYVEQDESFRGRWVKLHILGTPVSDDPTVYEEKDPAFFLRLGSTQSGAFATISPRHGETSETWLLDRSKAGALPRLVEPRTPGLRYNVEHHGDRLFILTNADGAEDFKLVSAPLANPGRSEWRDLVPHRPGVLLLYHTAFARHLVWVERENVKPRMVVQEIANGSQHEVSFPEDAYALTVLSGAEFDTDVVRYRYSSLTTPAETVDYDMRSRERRLRKRQSVPSGHDPNDYALRRIWATAPDGESVPVTLMHRKSTPLDGSSPCYLVAYGSYGFAYNVDFGTNHLSLVDRGFVYAVAHVRGGNEKGTRWYNEGKLDRKPNTFTDFFACAEALIAQGFAHPRRIVAYGGSAGGLVMGVAANVRPDLFAGIIADVPFVDVLNTTLDTELPLTQPEWREWGNPAADLTAFKTILSYSPYDNVRPQHYPPILALSGIADPRVTYWEPAKWVARLRDTITGGGPVMLAINMRVGHQGESGRFDQLQEVAFGYAFAMKAIQGF